jgi:hypothetical protein
MSDLVLHRGLNHGKCRSCGAAVIWAHTTAGKKSPFVVDLDGTFTIENGVARHAGPPPKQLELGGTPAEPRYKSHFADCADAPTWRKGRDE